MKLYRVFPYHADNNNHHKKTHETKQKTTHFYDDSSTDRYLLGRMKRFVMRLPYFRQDSAISTSSESSRDAKICSKNSWKSVKSSHRAPPPSATLASCSVSHRKHQPAVSRFSSYGPPAPSATLSPPASYPGTAAAAGGGVGGDDGGAAPDKDDDDAGVNCLRTELLTMSR